MRVFLGLLLLGLVALVAASPQRPNRDRDNKDRPHRGGNRDRDDDESGEDGECREAKLDSKRTFCRKAVVIVDEATECADATGAAEFISPQEICTKNPGQNVYMCKIEGHREVMDLVEAYVRDKLGDEVGRREIRDELCNEEADFSDLDLSSLKVEESTSKKCLICP